MKPKNRHPDQTWFINRELSWLAFNERVLEEAATPATPLLERVKFVAIATSNLDEFFMVRVAGLLNERAEGNQRRDLAGMTPSEQLRAVARRAHAQVAELYRLTTNDLLPALAAQNIRVASMAGLAAAQRAAVSSYFREEVLPALTPLAIDVSRPFPMLSSLSVNVAVWIEPVPGPQRTETGNRAGPGQARPARQGQRTGGPHFRVAR